jgi:hypothetical protein
MRLTSLSTALLSCALATAPISAASAQEEYHHHRYGLVGGVFGLAGALVVGAVTIVTLPIRVLADAASGPHYDRRGGYDQGRGGNYGGAPAYDGPNSYAGPRGEYADAPRYGYPSRGYYASPPQNYGPDYYRGRSENYPEAEGYDGRERGYAPAPPAEYARQEYNAPRSYYRERPEYGPPQNYGQRGDDFSGPPRGRVDDEQRSFRDRPDDDGDGD